MRKRNVPKKATKTKSTSTKLQEEITGSDENTHTPLPAEKQAEQASTALPVQTEDAQKAPEGGVSEAGGTTEPEKEVTANLEELKEAVTLVKEKRVFTSEELLEALYWIHYIFEKASMTMVLRGVTAICAYQDQPLIGEGIQIATRQLEWDSGNRHVIDTLAQYDSMREGYAVYKANNGVPVYLRILPDDYCISSPDTRLYAHEYFQFPNPLSRFEEVYGR